MSIIHWILEVLLRIVAFLLGLGDAHEFRVSRFSLAEWVYAVPGWLFLVCLVLLALVALFYALCQGWRHPGARIFLMILRGLALCLLLFMLLEPTLEISIVSQKRPALWLLFDGTDSMAIADEHSAAERAKLEAALGLRPQETEAPDTALPDTAAPDTAAQPTGGNGEQSAERSRSRADYVKAALEKDDGSLLKQLAKKFRLRAFLFERPDGARSLELAKEGRRDVDPQHLAEQLTTDGNVTALGAALHDLARREATANLAGLVVFSDFGQNAGPPALAAARELEVPVYTVGVGTTTAIDLSVGVQAPPHIKKDERGTITVTVRQQGLEGQTVAVSLSAVKLGGEEGAAANPISIGEKQVTLTGASQDVDFPYNPDKSGRFNLVAEVEPVPGEVVKENNRAQREITVLEDYLRLMFVEYEPTWEWRFIKEVFHRDKLVGMQGFRTFLRSSDPRVRQTNELFLPTMSPPRSEFFSYDVIFLGDMPASALSPRFCQMTEEFVHNFGGGLVVIAGPRFGPGQLADTPLAAMLPVKVDPSARINDRQPFRLLLSPRAEGYSFMQLTGEKLADNQKAWDNLGPLPWYQPVERLHPLATALAEHPTHACVDGKTRQPLIAIRKYGQGEVVYLGFDETWRLRRVYGEQYYRAFWGQLIHRLALSHELGSQKRFVVHTDRRRYQADEQVLLTIEAYNSEFNPLAEKDLPEQKLRGELILPARAAIEGDNVQPLGITQVREGVFETRFPVFAPGEYRVRVFDPITDKFVETTFVVTSVTVERQSATRNVDLQEAIAAVYPGGRSYELATVERLVDDINLAPKIETSVENRRLWNSPLCFGLVVVLLLGEWAMRKWVNLP